MPKVELSEGHRRSTRNFVPASLSAGRFSSFRLCETARISPQTGLKANGRLCHLSAVRQHQSTKIFYLTAEGLSGMNVGASGARDWIIGKPVKIRHGPATVIAEG